MWRSYEIFPNSSSVLVSDLQPIQCHSDNSEANGQPEWRFPNGTRVREDGVIVAIKEDDHVTLKQVDNSTSIPLGQYCCLAQDARGRSRTLCVNIIEGKHAAAIVGVCHTDVTVCRTESGFCRFNWRCGSWSDDIYCSLSDYLHSGHYSHHLEVRTVYVEQHWSVAQPQCSIDIGCVGLVSMHSL